MDDTFGVVAGTQVAVERDTDMFVVVVVVAEQRPGACFAALHDNHPIPFYAKNH